MALKHNCPTLDHFTCKSYYKHEMSKGVFRAWARYFQICTLCKFETCLILFFKNKIKSYPCSEEVLSRDLGAAHGSNLGIRSKESNLRYSKLRMTEVEKGSMLQLIATWVSQS